MVQRAVVIAYPDDESFGLGAVINRLVRSGSAVHILCYTHGEASTLNQTSADLQRAREAGLREASAELGAATVTLLDYPDGQLTSVAPTELAAHVTQLAARHHPDGVLVFDDTGNPRPPGRDPGGGVRGGRGRAACAGLDPSRHHRWPAAGRDRPAVHRAAAR